LDSSGYDQSKYSIQANYWSPMSIRDFVLPKIFFEDDFVALGDPMTGRRDTVLLMSEKIWQVGT